MDEKEKLNNYEWANLVAEKKDDLAKVLLYADELALRNPDFTYTVILNSDGSSHIDKQYTEQGNEKKELQCIKEGLAIEVLACEYKGFSAEADPNFDTYLKDVFKEEGKIEKWNELFKKASDFKEEVGEFLSNNEYYLSYDNIQENIKYFKEIHMAKERVYQQKCVQDSGKVTYIYSSLEQLEQDLELRILNNEEFLERSFLETASDLAAGKITDKKYFAFITEKEKGFKGDTIRYAEKPWLGEVVATTTGDTALEILTKDIDPECNLEGLFYQLFSSEDGGRISYGVAYLSDINEIMAEYEEDQNKKKERESDTEEDNKELPSDIKEALDDMYDKLDDPEGGGRTKMILKMMIIKSIRRNKRKTRKNIL